MPNILITINAIKIGAREMGQSVACLLCRDNDMRSIPRTTIQKIYGGIHVFRIQRKRQWRHGDP